MEMTMERLNQVITEASKAGNQTNTTTAQTQDLNPLAVRQIDELLASDQGVKALQSLFDLGKLTLPKPETTKQGQAQDGAEDEGEDAEMGRRRRGRNPVVSMIEQLDGALGQGMPWGSALVGGGTGFIVNDVINGFVDEFDAAGNKNMIRPIAKGVAAWAVLSFAPGFVGQMSANIGGALLVFNAFDDLVDLTGADGILTRFINWLRGFLPGGNANRFQLALRQQLALNTQNQLALNAGGGYQGMGQSISGIGEAGTNRLDYVFSPF